MTLPNPDKLNSYEYLKAMFSYGCEVNSDALLGLKEILDNDMFLKNVESIEKYIKSLKEVVNSFERCIEIMKTISEE